MGVWGPGPFENDDALDFTRELTEDGPPAVEEALDIVLDDDEGDLAAPEGSRGVAAAAVVAAVLAGDLSDLPESARDAAEALGRVHAVRLRSAAYAALNVVAGERSELAERWAETDGPGWTARLDRLRDVLRAEV